MIPRSLQLFLLAAWVPLLALGHGSAVRIKDITMISGARDNQLVGYGVVVGLAGEGDKNQPYTLQSLANLLQRFGVSVPASTLAAKNAAVVMLTADIRAFAKEGTRLDVTVSSIGDAKTLQGGTLIQAPMRGADGKVYAVAQGVLSVGGFVAGNAGASVQKNHPTVAVIPNGALVEREIPTQIVQDNRVDILLRDPDFTTAARMAVAINEQFPGSSSALDPMTVRVQVPAGLESASVDFIARLERIEVTPDAPARIIISERTGTIVATSRIQISACAVSHGDLTITIANSQDVSQPNALSQTGQTAVTQRTDTKVVEKKATLITLPEMPTVEKVASGLNAIGVTPRDMMAIFEAMKEAHALQAELILR
ncbi:MAG TPA: flagellar basal body P-ring protein FlgI [Candidatus Limnocylindria bacterium]|nr:flagellar basal body P-ring protein FlgI [Candidatus Limnocylindria bacterium]